MLFAYSTKAQYSSMTIRNHATCPVEIILYASFDYMGYLNCGLHTQLVIPAGGTVTQPTYWDFDAISPFKPLATFFPPILIDKATTFGPAPALPAPDAFRWEWVFVYGASTPGQTPGVGACFPTATCAGTPCGGAPCISSHTWVNTGGDIQLDIY